MGIGTNPTLCSSGTVSVIIARARDVPNRLPIIASLRSRLGPNFIPRSFPHPHDLSVPMVPSPRTLEGTDGLHPGFYDDLLPTHPRGEFSHKVFRSQRSEGYFLGYHPSRTPVPSSHSCTSQLQCVAGFLAVIEVCWIVGGTHIFTTANSK